MKGMTATLWNACWLQAEVEAQDTQLQQQEIQLQQQHIQLQQKDGQIEIQHLQNRVKLGLSAIQKLRQKKWSLRLEDPMHQNMEAHIQFLHDEILSTIEDIKKHLNRLEEIALKPNPLTELDYIDILIWGREKGGQTRLPTTHKVLQRDERTGTAS